MSDIAPFVAAALWDKAMADMIEENKQLRQQLRSARDVEITGSGGEPVYARGQLDEDGTFHRHRDPTIWRVKFSEQIAACSLSDLKDIQVWVGGTIRTNFGEFSSYYNVMDHGDYYYDKNNGRREKGYTVCFQPGTVWMDINLGWTDEELSEADLHLPANLDGSQALFHISERIARADPSKKCTFTSLAPALRGIRRLVVAVPGLEDRIKES